jgi:hypothetical protein
VTTFGAAAVAVSVPAPENAAVLMTFGLDAVAASVPAPDRVSAPAAPATTPNDSDPTPDVSIEPL